MRRMPSRTVGRFRAERLTLLTIIIGLGFANAVGQEQVPQSVVQHDPITSYKQGEILDIRAKALIDLDSLRIFYRYKNLKEFQVRSLERRDGNLYGYKLDTAEFPGLEFEYYIAATIGDRTSTLPSDPSQERFHVLETSAEAIPEIPAAEPTAAEAVPEAKFKWPAEISGSLQAILSDPQAPSDAETVKTNGNVRIFTKYQKNNTSLNLDSNFALASKPMDNEKSLDLSNLTLSLTQGSHTVVAGDINVNESEYSVSG
jgi:hypothetical protein